MSFNHYYQSELTALRQLGRRFAERSPALAPYLGQAGRDPDVERLLEGFAFLTGRLRQKLDDELPELSHSLMQLLWPNYMRPLPAFSILQFDPLGQPGPNERLSIDRANTVQQYLSQAGLGNVRMTSEGRGDREPVAQCGRVATPQAIAIQWRRGRFKAECFVVFMVGPDV